MQYMYISPDQRPSRLANLGGLIFRLVHIFMLAVHLVQEDYVHASKGIFTVAHVVIGILITSAEMQKSELFAISSPTKIMNAGGFRHSQSYPVHIFRSQDLDRAIAINVNLI